MENSQYSPLERLALWSLALVGFLLLNAVFLWAVLWKPELISQAMTNPVSAVFLAESFLLMGFLAYLLTKWKVARLHWAWFIALSLLGSMAFALPIVLLWPRREPR